jgi:hypothetical protein
MRGNYFAKLFPDAVHERWRRDSSLSQYHCIYFFVY